jgi:subtilase family serine protease
MPVPRARKLIALLFTATLASAAVGTTASADAGGTPNLGQSPYHRNVCVDTGQAGVAHCHAQVVTDAEGKPLATSGPSGYGPADLRSAYNLTTAGTGTVAIVDANDDPTAEADLAKYRSQFGLPACTSNASNTGCFRKVDQNGGTSYPAANASWAQEISLDLDVVSAICPGCKILLVETNSAYMTDLGTGVNTAARLGASAISNSYGGNEYSSETSDEATYFNHPGIAVTASSGDSGYGVEFPAASKYVTAVGGTTLNKVTTNSRGWTETAWSGAGSGCSAYEPKPAAQPYVGCGTSSAPHRMVADVSAVANPNTGVAVYDSTPYGGASGWLVFGGTSVASPLIAATYALNGNSGTFSNAYPYTHTGSLNDVTAGSNGHCRRVPALFCTAVSGYDGPTGLGTPNGISAF